MKRFLVALLLITPLLLQAQNKILLNATKAESAGNADWVIDADLRNLGYSGGPPVAGQGNESNPQQIPTPAQSGITASSPETFWSGGISAWGVDLVKQGYAVETLPYNGSITYGVATNPQDLSNYKVFIDCEPNILYTAAEKTAIIQFVQNGGGLFMVADHTNSDRNNDGYDSPEIWNDLMSNNTVQTNPFGITFDLATFSQTTTNIPSLPGDPILHGIMGDVTAAMWSSGTSITLTPSANSSVKGVIYKTGSSFGNTGVMFAYATFGSGKVAAIGDSSPADDGTGDPNDVLYNGWTGDANGNHERLIINATLWLASGSAVPTPVLSTAAVTGITTVSALSGGNITSDGGSAITSRGVCWSTSANPTVSDPHTANGSGTGSFTSQLTGLSASTTYHIRAYAVNANGTYYGNDISFATTCSAVTALPFTESFSGTAIPACWSQVDHIGNGQVWAFGTITGYTPAPALTGNYAYLSSDGYGSGNSQNADLVSPLFDLTGYTSVTLSFSHYFRSYTGSSGTVAYSTDNGATWTTLQTFTATTANPASFSATVNAAAGQPQVLFRWNYTGTWGHYWGVDNVQVTGTPCTPLPVSISMIASADTVCQGTPVTYTVTAVNGGTTPVYSWKVNGVPAGTNSSQFTYEPAPGEQVSCSVASSLSCVSGNPATVTLATVVNPALSGRLFLKGINVLPSASYCQAAISIFTADAGTVFTVQAGGSATLIAADTVALRPGTSVAAGGYLHAYITPVCTGCNTPAAPVISPENNGTEPGIAHSFTSESGAWRIFPNPAHSEVILEWTGADRPKDGSIILMDLTGRSILWDNLPPAAQFIGLQDISTGIYILKIDTPGHSQVLKLIKE